MDVSNRITNILNYYSENKGCDPNVNEFIKLCADYSDYLNREAPNYGIYAHDGITQEEARKKYPIQAAVSDKFNILCMEFRNKLLNNDLDITEDSPLYNLCEESIKAAITYSKYPDTELRANIGGVSLYIAQGKRDVRNGIKESFTYDNFDEMFKINKVCETTKNTSNYENRTSPRDLLVAEINNEYNKTYNKSNNVVK